MRKLIVLLFFYFVHFAESQAQFYSYMRTGSYFDGKFTIKKRTYSGYNFILSDFNRAGNIIKAKYFAQNAYSQYQNWKSGKEILLVTAGAYSNGYGSYAAPVGLCVDNGTIVTRDADNTMDGMVIIYNGGAQEGGVVVVDMDVSPVRANGANYYPRTSSSDRTNFLNWGQQNGLTLFQTHLVYSSDRTSSFLNLYYGKKQERRFLAICKTRSDGVIHHVIVDAPNPLELNLSASYAKAVLESEGFTVSYIMNLDTGAKNVLHDYNGYRLYDYQPAKDYGYTDASIENATNLIVYYK